MTLVLSASELDGLIEMDTAFDLLREGFLRAREVAVPGQRVATRLPGPGTGTALLPGLLPGVPAYTVKVNAKFPTSSPALRGLICLHDLDHGDLLGVVDSASITAWRTGLAAALATHVLAPASARSVAFVGAGAQAARVLAGLVHLRNLAQVIICDLDCARADAFMQVHVPHDLPAVRAASAADAADQADILILATWSQTALLGPADLRSGQHVTSLGADEPGKVELDPEVLSRSWLVVDDADLVSRAGAVANSGLDPSVIDATLGDVLIGAACRPSDTALSVYTPVGLPWQDLALTWPCYQAAVLHRRGTQIDLLA